MIEENTYWFRISAIEQKVMKMFYLEDIKSRQLYNLNRRRCLAECYMDEEGKSITKKIIYGLHNILENIKLKMRSKYYDKVSLIDSERIPVKKYSYNKIPKTVIYTVVIGEYDELHEPFYTNDNYDFILITDNDSMVNQNSAWKVLSLDNIEGIPKGLNSVQMNRWLKMNPSVFFSEYEVSIYIDGSVNIVTDMMPIILEFYESKSVIGMHLHSRREKILTEIRMLFYCGKINSNDKKRAVMQYQRYRRNGFDDSILLLEATIIIRRHNDRLCKDLMHAWWNEFINGVQRDQISLPYVIWSMGVGMDDIYILGDNEYCNPRFYISNHKKDNV